MKILVIGANGMLGQDLVLTLLKTGFEVLPTDIDQLDITNENLVKDFFSTNKFDLVIHTAAYTNVDGAESNQETAFLINEKGTENLARYSGLTKIPIVYISTDYVFDGTKNSPYEPNDKTNPINIYGLSKLKGEEAIKKYNTCHYITRTSWLYGHKGKNFVETMINLAEKNQELRVVDDQIGCPTSTMELTNGIIRLIKENKPFGIYHICGTGYTSWFGFATEIMRQARLNVKIIPVSTDEFPRPAKRPKFSAMENGGICRSWQDALADYIKQR